MKRKQFTDGERFKALSILNKHIGRQKAIAMPVFYEQVFGRAPESHISGTRDLRLLVTQLRNSGEPICSTTGGGYFLASTGSELEDYCHALKQQALRKLRIVSNLKKVSMANLCAQIELDLRNNSLEVEG
jgi:hypothetical protein